MPLFSRKVDYALIALAYLHHRAEGATARELASRFGLKLAFTAKVLKALSRAGLVAGARGSGGGYRLARGAGKVRIDDLLARLEEPFRLAECNGGPERCGMSGECPVRASVEALGQRILSMLHDVTLADLFGRDGAQLHQLEMVAAR
jgi:Rrf2 family iron-sulfur cluster assembly transcriptional regulator